MKDPSHIVTYQHFPFSVAVDWDIDMYLMERKLEF